MPAFKLWRDDEKQYTWQLLKEAPNILLPNGKIFLLSHSEEELENLKFWARHLGLKAGKVSGVRLSEAVARSDAAKEEARLHGRFNIPIDFYRLEITYGLKKAFPDKGQRKNWP